MARVGASTKGRDAIHVVERKLAQLRDVEADARVSQAGRQEEVVLGVDDVRPGGEPRLERWRR